MHVVVAAGVEAVVAAGVEAVVAAGVEAGLAAGEMVKAGRHSHTLECAQFPMLSARCSAVTFNTLNDYTTQ